MNALHLIVLIRKDVRKKIHRLEGEEIPTGFLNLVGNKGALGISLQVENKKILFITSHLAAGEGQTEKRNQEYDYIEKSLGLNVESGDIRYIFLLV
jgi:hypothetical protein